MEQFFLGKRAIINGASNGLGPPIVRQLIKYGCKVIAIDSEDLESLKEELPSIHTILVDVRKWGRTEEALAHIGPIDFLVNNAGEGFMKPLIDLKKEDVDKIFDVNIKALINVTQIIIRDLLARKKPGSIVNISSEAASVGMLHHTLYCASKAAVDAFTKAAAVEFAPHHIRVNSVNPTVLISEKGRRFRTEPHGSGSALTDDNLSSEKYHELDEVVDTVMYLLSDKSASISGSCLPADGRYWF